MSHKTLSRRWRNCADDCISLASETFLLLSVRSETIDAIGTVGTITEIDRYEYCDKSDFSFILYNLNTSFFFFSVIQENAIKMLNKLTYGL